MEIVSRDRFFSLTKDFENIPFVQSKGWFLFCSAPSSDSTVFLIDDISNPQIGTFGYIKKFLFWKMLILEGECSKSINPSVEIMKNFFSDLGKLPYSMIEINSSNIYNPDYEIAIRQSGFLRPVGVFCVAQTLLVDLTKELDYNRNWKRNLEKAKNNNLVFEKIANPTKDIIELFADTYNKMSSFKGFNQKASALQIEQLLSDEKMNLFVVKDKEGEICALRIVFCHGKTSTDVLAANTFESRALSASHFMMHSIFLYLQSAGIKNFDFAKIAVGHTSANSVYLFKNGVKGEKILYNGEWSAYKKSLYRPLMYFVKKYLMRRLEV